VDLKRRGIAEKKRKRTINIKKKSFGRVKITKINSGNKARDQNVWIKRERIAEHGDRCS